MDTSKDILILVDESEATHRTVTYVGAMLGGATEFRFSLVHVLPPMPPSLLEVGGSEDPATEQREETEAHEAQARWQAEAEKAAELVFERAKAVLREARVPEDAIETHCADSTNQKDVASTILDTARERGCSTIVVGREAYSKLRELLQHHVADELVRHGQGFAIWVVE